MKHKGNNVNDDICCDGRSDPGCVRHDVCFWDNVAKDGDVCGEATRIALPSTSVASPSQ